MEIDSLELLMDAVDMGLGSTIQPWAAVGRYSDAARRFELAEIEDGPAFRPAALCSLSDDELSPAALAARVVLADCVAWVPEVGPVDRRKVDDPLRRCRAFPLEGGRSASASTW